MFTTINSVIVANAKHVQFTMNRNQAIRFTINIASANIMDFFVVQVQS